MSQIIDKSLIRKAFSAALSRMFASEVPEYDQFVDIVKGSNEAFLKKNPDANVDSENRVLAEKHGAIRVGTPEEMHMVARIFAAMGMFPVEFYDMTQLPKGALPIIATAFRPIDDSIETSAFRMFTSMLHPAHITADIKPLVEPELAKRKKNNPKFSDKLLGLLEISESKGLDQKQTDEFIKEVVDAFRIDKQKAVNFELYKTLRGKNDVFADIVCLGININHLTPRAYDIQDAQKRLENKGIPMKDGGIEGPPIRDDAPNIQLNQTSRKAPGESLFVSNDEKIINDKKLFESLKSSAKRITLNKDESVADYLTRISETLKTEKLVDIEHKARFGEIESRGTALTIKGEALYKTLLAEKKFKTDFPKTHQEMHDEGLAYYTYEIVDAEKVKQIHDIMYGLHAGYIKLKPQTYNDFLAASAAGIFKSNMTTGVEGIDSSVKTESANNKEILEAAIGRKIISRHELHEKEYQKSVEKIRREFKL